MKTENPPASTHRYTNIALSVIAVMLSLLTADRFLGNSASGMSVASAAPEEITELTNSLEQNRQIIAELRSINSRLEKLSASIRTPMPVKVIELPAGFNQQNDVAPASDGQFA